VELRFTGPYMEGQFGALYGVVEIMFTLVKAFFETITKNIAVHL
jgi:hypothetical protein